MNTNAFAQALAWICWTDTFTRTTAFGLGSDYTWDGNDTSYAAAADSEYFVNGTQVTTSDTWHFDSYTINRNVPEDGIVQFDFWSPQQVNSSNTDPTYGLNFGLAYPNNIVRHEMYAQYNGDGTWSIGQFNTAFEFEYVTEVLDESAMYTVKMVYTSSGKFAYKHWKVGTSEPDWIYYGDLNNSIDVVTNGKTYTSYNRAWIDFYDGADNEATFFDNLKFCYEAYPSTNAVAQAIATIITTTPNAQAQALIGITWGIGNSQASILRVTNAFATAQVYINLESITLPYLDTFVRSATSYGLGPNYLWESSYGFVGVDHPAAGVVHLNGSSLLVPGVNGATDSFYISATLPTYALIQLDVKFSASLFGEGQTIDLWGLADNTKFQFFANAGIGTVQIGAFGLSGTLSISYNSTLTYRFVMRMLNGTIRVEIRNASTNAVLASGDLTGAGSAQGNPYIVLGFWDNAPSVRPYNVYNLIIDSNYNQASGQAKAQIRVTNNKFAQAQAKIAPPPLSAYGQAQATISRPTNWMMANAQADIKQTYPHVNVPILVQSKSFNGTGNGPRTFTMDSPVTAGHLLVIVAEKVNITTGITSGSNSRPFTDIPDSPFYQHTAGGDLYFETHLAYRTASGDEQSLTYSGNDVYVTLFEFSSFDISVLPSLALTAQIASTSKVIGTLSPPGDFQITALIEGTSIGGDAPLDQTPGTGWTLDTADGKFVSGSDYVLRYYVAHSTTRPVAQWSGTARIWGGAAIGITGVTVGPTFAQAQADIVVIYSSFAQAQARILTTYNVSAQAQAKIIYTRLQSAAVQTYINFEISSLPFIDEFNRTTVYGLGSKYFLWNPAASSVDHPVVTTTYLNGTGVVVPTTVVNDGYYIGLLQFPHSSIVSIDIKFSDAFGEAIAIPNSGTNPGKLLISHGNDILLFSEGSNTTFLTPFDSSLTYRFVATLLSNDTATIEIRNAADDSVFSTLSYSGISTTGTSVGYVQLNFSGASGISTIIDRIEIDEIVGRGFGQANSRIITFDVPRSGQAQALIDDRFALANVQASITQIRATLRVFAQANAWISPRVSKSGQAQALIGHLAFGQSNALIDRPLRYAQAQALILKIHWQWAQAQALINNHYKFAQARTYIYVNPAIVYQAFALVNADIVGYYLRHGQAQCFIDTPFRVAQAQCFIYQPAAGKLVQYNKYGLPGYLQRESFSSTERLYLSPPPSGFEEYLGRENKSFEISMLVVDQTYQAAKEQVTTAATMLWSNRSGYSKLIVIHAERYYLAKTQSIRMEQTAGTRENAAGYEVTFDCQPWSYGQIHTMTTVDTDDVGRTYLNGTWTPATITLTGTDITVSGYTPNGDFTGFISISGYVENLTLDNDNLSTIVTNGDYALFIAPGRTLFDINGATSYTIQYTDRWEL